MTTKRCIKCGEQKPLASFHRNGSKGYLRPECRGCTSIRQKRHYAANREDKALEKRLLRAYNGEKINAQRRARRAANIEKARAQARANYAANKDKIKAGQKRYRDNNPGLFRAKGKLRELREARQRPAWASLVAIRTAYWYASAWTKATGIAHHVDHIVPLAGRLVTGLHVQDNLQIIPAELNIMKSNYGWPHEVAFPEGK